MKKNSTPDAQKQWLEKYGFKCDKCHGWFDFFDIASITSTNEQCDPFTQLQTTCKKCNNENNN